MYHYIITRFNLPLWNKDKNNNFTLNENWLKNRFDLFDKYCFPSLLNQTNKNFVWYVLFHDKNDEEYKSIIFEYKKKLPQFEPVFFNDEESKNYLEIIQEKINSKTKNELIITTRIDNDDCFNINYIDAIQTHYLNSKNENEILSFPKGCQYFLNSQFVLELNVNNNHYLSLMEKAKNGKINTILSLDHSKVKNPKLLLTEDFMWLEVIHNSNVSNDIRFSIHNNRFVFKNISLKIFGINVFIPKHKQIKSLITFFTPHIICLFLKKIKNKIFYGKTQPNM